MFNHLVSSMVCENVVFYSKVCIHILDILKVDQLKKVDNHALEIINAQTLNNQYSSFTDT